MFEAKIDNRARLVGAILAAGSWPEREQTEGAHRVHQQARLARSFAGPYADHPAVVQTDAFLAAGGAVGDLYTAALRSRWPTFERQEEVAPALADGQWLESVADFYTDTAIAAFHWSEQASVWEGAAADLQTVMAPAVLGDFFAALLGGPLDRPVHLYPNLLYPALTPLLVTAAEAHTLLVPPPKALGESPPWAYREGAEWVLTSSVQLLGEQLLRPQLAALGGAVRQRTIHALTALFLENTLDSGAARAYQVQIARTAGVADLDAAVDRLRAYVTAPNGDSLLAVMRGTDRPGAR